MSKSFEQKSKQRWQKKVEVTRQHNKNSAAACNFFTLYYAVMGMRRR